MLTTANYGLKKPEGTDVVNIDDFNYNADIIDTQIKNLNDNKVEKAAGKGLSTNDYTTVEKNKLAGIVAKGIDYAVASGTNTYTATISDATLIEGRSYKIKFTNANTGASTLNINSLGAKTIQKSNGNALASGNIKAGQILHLVYTGSVFQLLGEGGEYGTATASDVLAGKTIGTDTGLVVGTIKKHTTSENRITESVLIDGASTQGALYVKPEAGWYDGLDGWVQVSDPNFKKENIPNGMTILGKTGTLVPSNVNNIQRGVSTAFNNEFATTMDITISSVDTAKTIVRVYNSQYGGYATGAPKSTLFSIVLLNSTTIRITRESTSHAITELVWEVIEFNNVKSLQTGTKTTTDGNTIIDIPISTVNINKSLVFVSWTGGYGSDTRSLFISPYLTTSANLHIYTPSYYAVTYYWQVIEFN